MYNVIYLPTDVRSFRARYRHKLTNIRRSTRAALPNIIMGTVAVFQFALLAAVTANAAANLIYAIKK